jgi:hypothetical protein
MFSAQPIGFNRILNILLDVTHFDRPSAADVKFLEDELLHADRMTSLTLAEVGTVVERVGAIDPEDMFMHAMGIIDSNDSDGAALRRFNRQAHDRFRSHDMKRRAVLRGLFVILLEVMPKPEED